eukprot:364696-Chlamydomonas_euryale.AAC.4
MARSIVWRVTGDGVAHGRGEWRSPDTSVHRLTKPHRNQQYALARHGRTSRDRSVEAYDRALWYVPGMNTVRIQTRSHSRECMPLAAVMQRRGARRLRQQQPARCQHANMVRQPRVACSVEGRVDCGSSSQPYVSMQTWSDSREWHAASRGASTAAAAASQLSALKQRHTAVSGMQRPGARQ